MTTEEMQQFAILNGKVQSLLVEVSTYLSQESDIAYIGYEWRHSYFALKFGHDITIWGQYPYLLEKNWILNQIDFLKTAKATLSVKNTIDNE